METHAKEDPHLAEITLCVRRQIKKEKEKKSIISDIIMKQIVHWVIYKENNLVGGGGLVGCSKISLRR